MMNSPLEKVLKMYFNETYWSDPFNSGMNQSDIRDTYRVQEKLREFIDPRTGLYPSSLDDYKVKRAIENLSVLVYNLCVQIKELKERNQVYDHLFAAMLGDKEMKQQFLEFIKYKTQLEPLDLVEIIDRISNVQEAQK